MNLCNERPKPLKVFGTKLQTVLHVIAASGCRFTNGDLYGHLFDGTDSIDTLVVVDMNCSGARDRYWRLCEEVEEEWDDGKKNYKRKKKLEKKKIRIIYIFRRIAVTMDGYRREHDDDDEGYQLPVTRFIRFYLGR